MLKNKIPIEIKTFHIPNQNCSFRQTERVCQFCRKTFCCKNCRDRHVDKVHPGLNAACFLCASKALPVRLSEIKILLEDEQLLSHIVDKHLPLHCQLCGCLVESKEDFKSFGACKWWSQYRNPLTSPMYGPLGKKLKQCFLSDSDYNNSRFSTPSEIHRKTSTPRLVGQRASFEYQTPCTSNFSLKTHESQNTVFLSFSPHYLNEETTPFKTGEEHLVRSNSGRKLDIMEECDEIANYEIEKIIAYDNQSPTTDMDMTMPISNIVQCTPPESNIIRKESDKTPDIVKKVRFSDQHETLSEFESPTESYVKNILNISAEEEDDVFHNICEMSRTQNVKNAENSKDTGDAKNIKDSQAEGKKCSEKFLSDSQIQIARDNIKNARDENRNPEINNNAPSASEQGSNGMMMMIVLMENHSCKYNTDLVPLIDSGLKKLQEQLASMSCQLSSDTNKTLGVANLRRKSITKMEMRLSSVERNSMNSATVMNHRQIISSSSFMQNDENKNNGGFLSTVTQAMKSALKSLSARSITTTEVTGQREIIEESTSPQESSIDTLFSNPVSNIQTRPGKRSRDVSEMSSKADSIAFPLDVKSPVAKRQRGWYTMIKGRQPIRQVRKNRMATSPRGVSAETQIFSQGSLTVGDTILPLPTRAHQSTQTESARK